MPKTVRYGILLMISCEVLFAFVWAAIKFIGTRIPIFEIVFFRAAISLAVLIPIMLFRGSSFKGKNKPLLMLCSLTGLFGVTFAFIALVKIDLGNASVLLNMFPIFVAIFAPLFIREPFSRLNLAFILLAFIGVWLIIKPDYNILNNASLFGVLASVCGAFSIICTRKLIVTDGPTVITFWFTAFITVALLPLAARDFVWPNLVEWALLAWIGAAVTAGQLLLTKAYRYGDAAVISPFAYTSSLVSYILAIFIWRDIPDMLSIIGGALIVLSGVAITYTTRSKPELTT